MDWGCSACKTAKKNAKEILWMGGWGCCIAALFALHPEARQESSKHCIALGSGSPVYFKPCVEKRVMPLPAGLKKMHAW